MTLAAKAAPPRFAPYTPGAPVATTTTESSLVRLSEVLAALSRALDLAGGQPAGHSARSCLVGMRLADEIGLGGADRSALYYALLLKDAGCSSNAARMSALFGSDDRAVKARMRLVDLRRPLALAVETWRCAGRHTGGTLADRLDHFLCVARTPGVRRDLIQVRCDRGAEIALGLGFPQATAEAIRCLDEHWGGGGYPDGRRGEEIPLLARIASLAQCLESLRADRGSDAALEEVCRRGGAWFDPALVSKVLAWRADRAWWDALSSRGSAERVVAAEPPDGVLRVDETRLDEVARAFADIIDAKSPFTARHSSNVAEYADGAGRAMGLGSGALAALRRAALLHDVGNLGVSNRILDKAGPLTEAERREVERHPAHTWGILSVVDAFRPFAWTAAVHHEKLDGSGYPWGIGGDELDPSARLLAVADVYEALTADRPYRMGMRRAGAFAILASDRAAGKLCGRAIDALAAFLDSEIGSAGRSRSEVASAGW